MRCSKDVTDQTGLNMSVCPILKSKRQDHISHPRTASVLAGDFSSIFANLPANPGRYTNSAFSLHCHVSVIEYNGESKFVCRPPFLKILEIWCQQEILSVPRVQRPVVIVPILISPGPASHSDTCTILMLEQFRVRISACVTPLHGPAPLYSPFIGIASEPPLRCSSCQLSLKLHPPHLPRLCAQLEFLHPQLPLVHDQLLNLPNCDPKLRVVLVEQLIVLPLSH
jgi:hypothetical protein